MGDSTPDNLDMKHQPPESQPLLYKINHPVYSLDNFRYAYIPPGVKSSLFPLTSPKQIGTVGRQNFFSLTFLQ